MDQKDENLRETPINNDTITLHPKREISMMNLLFQFPNQRKLRYSSLIGGECTHWIEEKYRSTDSDLYQFITHYQCWMLNFPFKVTQWRYSLAILTTANSIYFQFYIHLFVLMKVEDVGGHSNTGTGDLLSQTQRLKRVQRG
jgi:hypothetical protein